MTIDEYIAKLEFRRRSMLEDDGPLHKAAASVHVVMVRRIFTDGLAADGNQIGQYDTAKPLYVNPLKAPVQFKPAGKTGEVKFKDGSPHKTGYFSNYKAFRQNQGRKTDKVNLHLFGDMQIDFSNSLKKAEEGVWVSGFNGGGDREKLNRAKAVGNQKRFGRPIFALTKEERELFLTVLKQETAAIHNA